MASAVGINESPAVPVIFTVVVLLGIGGGVYKLVAPEPPDMSVVVPKGKNPGVYFIPSDDTNTVMSVTMLESAVIQFEARHKRLPKNFKDLRSSGIIKHLRKPKEGFKFQLDLEWPEIIEVPIGTPPLKGGTDLDEEDSEKK